LFCELRFRDAEEGGEFLDVFSGGLRLAVEESCDGDFGAAEFAGDGFEGQGFGGFGVEEGFGGGRKAVNEGCLERKLGQYIFVRSEASMRGRECGVIEGQWGTYVEHRDLGVVCHVCLTFLLLD